ncbi:MAG TPA: hypothetical protein VNO52_17105 [Methylomirabilota bacterium]|nr:hypothetical protein [Methylomirabilota bacterium]
MKTSLALAAAMAAGFCMMTAAAAAEQVKGAEKLVQLQRIETTKDLEALQPGDLVAMSCPKCKNITVTYVTKEKGHIETTTAGIKHTCPGCQNKIEVTGHGKAKKNVVKHVCQKCGSKSAFCCVLKKGAAPTEGMEQK